MNRPPAVGEYECVDVVDGAELVIVSSDGDGGSERVRLAGIWAPGVIDADPSWRVAARESIADLRARAKGWRLYVVDVPESSQRQAHAFVNVVEDGSCLNETLVRDGFAFFDPEQPIGEVRRDRLVAAEKAAIDERIGLWGPIDAIRIGSATTRGNQQAANWLAMANGLKAKNPRAAEEYYRRIIAEAPTSPSAIEAKEKLGLPEGHLPEPPPLTRELAKSLLGKIEDGMSIRRPVVVTAPSRPKSGDRPPSSVPDGAITNAPGRRSPGTSYGVKGYTRKDGTYVPPHRRTVPGAR